MIAYRDGNLIAVAVAVNRDEVEGSKQPAFTGEDERTMTHVCSKVTPRSCNKLYLSVSWEPGNSQFV
jgi:hypothetical protein